MNVMNMTAYSVIKNEDAIPYAGKNLLVVADGLGGSGSFIHKIDRNKFCDMEQWLYKSAFYDFNQGKIEDLKKYFKELLKDLIDEENDTSALWASRIVCARYVYAISILNQFEDLTSLKKREELAKFILDGLSKTKEEFQLENGKYSHQLLLPTTLASIRYSYRNSKILVDVLWVGDSRCYALTKSGLSQLTLDDEDASGAITNLFYEGNKNIRLNYKKYEYTKPCILFVVSDGFFDPFDSYENLWLENFILDGINKSSTMDEFKQYLSDKYTSIHQDDASIALAAIGFHDFISIKNHFKNRKNVISKLVNEFIKYQDFLSVKEHSEVELRDYIFNRTSDKYDTIKNIIISALFQNKPYSFQFLKKSFESIKMESKIEYTKQYQKSIIKYVEDTIKNRILPPFRKNVQSKDINKICNNNREYFKNKKELDKLDNQLSLLKQQKSNILNSYHTFKQEDDLNDLSCDIKSNIKKIETKIKTEFNFKIKSILKQIKNTQNIQHLLQKKYNKQILKLFQKYDSDFELLKKDINIHKLNFKIEQIDLSKIKEKFSNYLEQNKEWIIPELTKQLKEKESIIDFIYNPTRLKHFRIYYKIQKNSSKTYLKFEEKLKQVNLEYIKRLY